MRFFGFSSRRVYTTDDHSTIQDGETSSFLKEDAPKYLACSPLLQEEYGEDPCRTQDPTIQHLIIGSVGGKITSSFFVGDVKIIAKEDYVVNGGKEYFWIRSKRRT